MVMPKQTTKQSGDVGEEIARRFLREKGLELVDLNYRYGHGEIDIIAKDGEVLVFCEVKMRKGDSYGDPEYAITARKQKQIRRIAQAYLYQHAIDNQACRFDVVAIRMKGITPQINYIKNAF
ncbi:MAG: YraN family protein [Ignavibacteriae bacterium]|nr:YraN family protein [Ignavibacteriota bacterium]